MAAPQRLATLSNKNGLVPVLSLIIPGSGQFVLGRRWRGVSIFLVAAILGFLVNWALTTAKIGQVTLGSAVTSWLWLPFVLFWVWNVLDARSESQGRSFNLALGLIFAGI